MRYAGVIPNDIVNGNGICVSFWTQGCSIRCEGCHNPQTWNKCGGYELPDNYIDRVLSFITKNGIRRNLSILGGEPFDSFDIIFPLIKEAKRRFSWIKIFLWTGHSYRYVDALYPEVFPYIDYLISGPFEKDKRDVSLWLRGSTNQIITRVGKGE